jgi:hypothetical protein
LKLHAAEAGGLFCSNVWFRRHYLPSPAGNPVLLVF